MTYAPTALLEVRGFLKGQDTDLVNAELGIAGGPAHIAAGTSYHLGADQLKMSKNPYSARTARDRAGLASAEFRNAASALDIDDDLDDLRGLSVWLVEQCRRGTTDTADIREVIYSPDGVRVLRWDRERGVLSLPVPDSDLSHRAHTHVSWYRDSVARSKVGVFQRFYVIHGKGSDMFLAVDAASGRFWIGDGAWRRELTRKQYEGWKAAGVTDHGASTDITVYGDDVRTAQTVAPPAPPFDEDALRRILREEIAKTRLS